MNNINAFTRHSTRNLDRLQDFKYLVSKASGVPGLVSQSKLVASRPYP
jgi:hypothetical protein